VTWSIYYADGKKFLGPDWKYAPRHGVIAVLHQGVIEHGFDWYAIEDGRWIGIKGDASLILKVLHRLERLECVFAGEAVPNETFQPILARAVKDQADDLSSNRTALVPAS
jgi:hypothetical protein